jgi:iron complex outermembrane receptor protein
LSEIVILGDRVKSSSTAGVYEIKREVLNGLNIQNPSQAMEFFPGIYFSQNFRNERIFRLRGFEQRQVNVFLDGIPISVPFDGVVDISQISGDYIEDIRITKGVSSVQYGANTLGGNVNIRTSVPNKSQEIKFRLEGSNHGRLFSSLNYMRKLGKLNFVTSFSINKSPNFKLSNSFQPVLNEDGGRRENSNYVKRNVSLKLGYNLNDLHKIGFRFNWINNWFNVPVRVLIRNPRYWQFPEWQKNVFSFTTQHIFRKNFLLRTVFYWDNYHNKLESFDDGTYSTQTFKYTFTSIYDDYSLGGILYPQLNIFPVGTTKGIVSVKRDVHREKSAENISFEKYKMETLVLGLEQELKLSSNLNAILGSDVHYLKPLFAEGKEIPDPILLSNAYSRVQFIPSSSVVVHFGIGKKSRFPTLKELYSGRLDRNIPNPDLKPEYAIDTEFGVKYQIKNGSLLLSLFYNRLRDLITNRQLGNNIQQYQNTSRAIYKGIDFDFQLPLDKLEILLNYTLLHAKNISSNRSSDYLEYRPKHRWNGIINILIQKHINWQFESNITAYQHYQNIDTGEWEKLNDYSSVNTKINFQFKSSFNLYFRINNLFDRNYFSEFGIPVPGREIITGIIMNF